MDIPRETLKRVGMIFGYLLLGAIGTAISAVFLFMVTQPLRTFIYDTFYLTVGPWTATTASTVIVFMLVSVVAISVPVIIAEYLADRFENMTMIVGGLALMVSALLIFLLFTVFSGTIGFGPAIIAFAVLVVSIPVGLHFVGVRYPAIAAFAGGLPVFFLLLLALGFGLGWGGGYDLVAQEVPPSSVNGTTTDFSEVPKVRDDLFNSDNCYEEGKDVRTCRLPLRGYEHEAPAARFLDKHGVRCSFLNARDYETGNRSFIAEHNGTYYRVSCMTYGD